MDDAHHSEAGVTAATKLVRAAAGDDAALLFAALVRARLNNAVAETFDLTEVEGLCADSAWAEVRVKEADNAFAGVFGFHLLKRDFEESSDGALGRRRALSGAFKRMLEFRAATPPEPSARLDATAMQWVRIALMASRSAIGHHLAMRCAKDDRRCGADFAAQLAAAGARVIHLHGYDSLLEALLRAELLGGGHAVVVCDGPSLVGEPAAPTGWETESEAPSHDGALEPSREARAALSWLDKLANVYVWPVPEHGDLPADVRRFIGACFGPIRYDTVWQISHVKTLAPGIDAHGARALLAQAGDARDTLAMAALGAALAGTGIPGCTSVSSACLLVGESFGTSPATTASEILRVFDESLLACDADGTRLLARGRELARGARVLAFGAPGTGKSAYARVLAARIAEASDAAPMILIEPAMLLARSWGETERRIASLWQQAYRNHAVLIADEFDSMAAVRDANAPPSGNAYLIRGLTNEFLRQMDAYPAVCLIATVNDRDALDPAIRRRFSIAIEMREALSPAQERRAWSSILDATPPRDWTACGACVADFTAARERCRLMGRRDAKTYAAAILEARANRLGLSGEDTEIAMKRRLH